MNCCDQQECAAAVNRVWKALLVGFWTAMLIGATAYNLGILD